MSNWKLALVFIVGLICFTILVLWLNTLHYLKDNPKLIFTFRFETDNNTIEMINFLKLNFTAWNETGNYSVQEINYSS